MPIVWHPLLFLSILFSSLALGHWTIDAPQNLAWRIKGELRGPRAANLYIFVIKVLIITPERDYPYAEGMLVTSRDIPLLVHPVKPGPAIDLRFMLPKIKLVNFPVNDQASSSMSTHHPITSSPLCLRHSPFYQSGSVLLHPLTFTLL